MLANIATMLSSPLVHSFIIFLVLRFIYLFFKIKIIIFCSWLPVTWLLICSMTYPSVLLIKNLEDQYPVVSVESKEWRKTDAIVVLACNHFEDQEMPFVSRWPNCSMQRNLHAALMYQAFNKPIYLAGGILSKKDTESQASHNRHFFNKMGIKDQDIFTTHKGKNTETEAAALAKILPGKYISLVTSASHLPRAVQYFEERNIKVLPIPVEHLSRRNIKPVLGIPNARSLYRSERAIHEYLGLIYQHYLR